MSRFGTFSLRICGKITTMVTGVRCEDVNLLTQKDYIPIDSPGLRPAKQHTGGSGTIGHDAMGVAGHL